ncbi:hypothetical protein UT300002_15950 [Clostridium perfringens]
MILLIKIKYFREVPGENLILAFLILEIIFTEMIIIYIKICSYEVEEKKNIKNN